MIKINEITTRILMLLIILILFIPINPIASSTLSFEENFEVESIENLTGWHYIGCNPDTWKNCVPTDHGFTISNGALIAEDTPFFTPFRRALHNSSIGYGNWSFDWTVSSNGLTYDAVEFMLTDHTDNYEPEGKRFLSGNFTGYALLFISYPRPSQELEPSPSISLIKFDMGDPHVDTLEVYPWSSNLAGTYHIDIQRDLNGHFKVYVDQTLIIQYTDNKYGPREKFAFTSFQGNSSIDNISISGIESPMTEATTTTVAPETSNGFLILFSLSGLVLSVILRKFRK